jgi:ATP-binding cassette subfamily B protein
LFGYSQEWEPEHYYRGANPIKTLLHLYRKDWGKVALAMTFFFLKYSPVWIVPLLAAGSIDVISYPSQHSLSELFIYGTLAMLVILQNIPTNYLYIRFVSSATRNIGANLRTALSRRLQLLSMHFYYRSSTGGLQAKLLRDVEMIEEMARLLFEQLPSVLITISVALIVTALRVPWFLVFFLLTVPAAVLLSTLLRTRLTRNNRTFRTEVEDLAAKVNEMIHMIPLTRAHGVEQAQLEQLKVKLYQVREAGVRLDSVNAFFGASAWVVFRLFDSICLMVAGYLAYTRTLPLTLGEVVLLTGFFGNLTNSVSQIMTILPQLTKGFESIRSVGEILEYDELEEIEGKPSLDAVKGHFVFDQVSFSYPEAERYSLDNFSLDVQPGETVAFVGSSGAGKSTIINLIIGFLRPTHGHVLLDGADLNTLDLRTYRRFISVVSQETVMFKGTIRENILYGLPEANQDQLDQAVADANMQEFIEQLPDGYDTMLGENGTRLSGGQRQRISIARALVRQPRVLILDEATSALDTTSESQIQEALGRLMKKQTTFIVAHRLSTVKNADRIVVLEQGQIVEMGNHAELLAQKGIYYRMYSATL